MQCDKPDKPEPEMRETSRESRERSSTSSLPTMKLLTVGKFIHKEVEKMKSISSTAFKLKFGREKEAANQMHRDRDRVAGFPCDEKCREDASP